MSNYMKELAKSAGNEFASLVDDGIFGGDVENFIDTGLKNNSLISKIYSDKKIKERHRHRYEVNIKYKIGRAHV